MRRAHRQVTFEVRYGRLVRQVDRPGKPSYTHHCTLEVLREVAWLVEARGDRGVTSHELWEALPAFPCTQISVALEFLKELGAVEESGRRSYAASSTLFEDAMIEFHYLAHVAQTNRKEQAP